MLRLGTPPKLRYCIIGYFAGLFLLGAIPVFVKLSFVEGLHQFWMNGLAACFFPYVFFVMTLKYPGEWLNYCVVLGLTALIIAAGLKLKGWPRNLAVIGLLFAAGMYGIYAGSYYFY